MICDVYSIAPEPVKVKKKAPAKEVCVCARIRLLTAIVCMIHPYVHGRLHVSVGMNTCRCIRSLCR